MIKSIPTYADIVDSDKPTRASLQCDLIASVQIYENASHTIRQFESQGEGGNNLCWYNDG